jgi:hypothetical protein
MERGLITIFLKRHDDEIQILPMCIKPERLQENLNKGFTMNDDLLKQDYWKILEIYATSIVYSAEAYVTKLFFKPFKTNCIGRLNFFI